MSTESENIIHVLPDAVANQIAAGEVIQRPASVVKELVENAIDAGATKIDVVLKEAGRTLIRVTDNGKGMSPDDARLAFERHATSKICKADDLFHLHTMGFRGEALASIASVAQVELVTRRPDDELAWKVEVEGSTLINQEHTLAAQGSRFSVRNLFYNIPARRKFLGENAKELKAIRDEFVQIALVYPELHLTLTHNDEPLLVLPPAGLKQRILAIFGKRNAGQLSKQLYPVDVDTQLLRITGFVGDPSAACQRDQMQYFFVNGRFIRHKPFRSAVMKAYELLIPQGQQPTFFLYFEVDPEALDINIHPTKTEVKFEHEQAIWPILHATVREALGKANAVPSIDFDREDAPEIRVFTGDRDVPSPSIQYDPNYNPFKGASTPSSRSQTNWDDLFQGFEKHKMPTFESKAEWPEDYPASSVPGESTMEPLFEQGFEHDTPGDVFPLFSAYLIHRTPASLLLIDSHRAHLKVLYEGYREMLQQGKPSSQVLLFAETLPLDAVERICLLETMDDLLALGFEITCSGDEFSVTAVPSDLKGSAPAEVVEALLHSLMEGGALPLEERRHRLALQLAKAAAVTPGRTLLEAERNHLVKRLLALKDNGRTPDGKIIFWNVTEEELKKHL
jgi:DNA mismatch repair protein MutL